MSEREKVINIHEQVSVMTMEFRNLYFRRFLPKLPSAFYSCFLFLRSRRDHESDSITGYFVHFYSKVATELHLGTKPANRKISIRIIQLLFLNRTWSGFKQSVPDVKSLWM